MTGKRLKGYQTSWLSDTNEGHSYHEFAKVKVGEDGVTDLYLYEPDGKRDYIEVYKGSELPHSRDYDFDWLEFYN